MTIDYMPIEDFRDAGYLHEVNRVLLHPLGLALEVWDGLTREDVEGMLEAAGVRFGADAVDCVMTFVRVAGLDREHLSGVWDYRDDPEGIRFGEVDEAKAALVADEFHRRAPARQEALGYVIQPAEADLVDRS